MAIINGTTGSDRLNGTEDADTINGLEGNDTLVGGGGADTLNGGDGDDVLDAASYLSTLPPPFNRDQGGNILLGEAGNDTLLGGPGDTLDGGAGDDVIKAMFVFTRGDTSFPTTLTKILGGDGNDTITVSSVVANIDAGAGNDTLYLSVLAGTRLTTGPGSDIIHFPLGGNADSQPALTITDFGVSGSNIDVLDLGDYVFGGVGFQSLRIGQQGANVLIYSNANAAGGNSGGYVILENLDGTKLTAANFLGQNPGTLWTLGSAGSDTLIGTDGADHLDGYDGADTIFGGAGDDVLEGGRGSDVLIGGPGADIMTGGTAALPGVQAKNTFVINSGDSTPTSSDTIIHFFTQYGSSTDTFRGDTLDLSSLKPSAITISNFGSTAQLIATDAVGAILAQINFAPFAYFAEGYGHSDGIIGGTDILTGGPAVPMTLYGKGAPGVYGPFSYADVLVGGGANDALFGGDGGEKLVGGGGADTLYGGGGADTFAYALGDSTAAATDTIKDFEPGIDKLDLYQLGSGVVSLVRTSNGAVVFGPTFNGAQTQIYVNGPIQGADVLRSEPTATSSSLGIEFIGLSDTADLLLGGLGPDKLYGLSGNDTLIGGAGDDQLFGDAGADVLTGGPGADRFAYRGFADSNAVDGYDIVTDFVSGTDKIDLTYLNGLQSVALVRSGAGTFMFAATSGGQVQVGFTDAVQGTDVINPVGTAATFGYDLVGQAAGETLIGSGGNDRIFGLGGNDVITGGAGDDILYGDAGADLLTGGAGADVFAYRGAADSPVSGFDKILDFQSGVDKIDLRMVHTSAADKYGFLVQGGDTFLFLDQSGDGTSEFLIVLQGVTNLQPSDILF